MKQTCQSCGERATFHITEVEDVGYNEVHLCHKCATTYFERSDDDTDFPALQQKEAPSTSVPPTAAKLSCPHCKLSFSEFRKTGRLGCPHDYEVFRNELKPLLDNIHGALRHVGKIPHRMPHDTHFQNQLVKLRQQLQEAVSVEDYERAARIRDEIENMEKRPTEA